MKQSTKLIAAAFFFTLAAITAWAAEPAKPGVDPREKALVCPTVGSLQLHLCEDAVFVVYPKFNQEGSAEERFTAAACVASAYVARDWCFDDTINKYMDPKADLCAQQQRWFSDVLDEGLRRTLPAGHKPDFQDPGLKYFAPVKEQFLKNEAFRCIEYQKGQKL